MSDGSSYEVEALSLAGAAALMRLGEDALRGLIVMGEIPALSLNRKHIVLLREDVIEFMRTHAKRQQAQRRAAWQSAENHSELGAMNQGIRKPGRRRAEIPSLTEPADCREALKRRKGRLASADWISARGSDKKE